MAHRHEVPQWVPGLIGLVGVLVLYFSIPVSTHTTTARVLIGLALALAGVGMVAIVVTREVRRELSGQGARGGVLRLVLMLEIVMIAFALVYYSLSVHSPGSVAGISTRLDSLYFSATTMTTVGYGDIHPVSQFARAITTVQLGFDLVFVAALAGLVSRRARENNR